MDTKSLTGEQARRALFSGINLVANSVRATLGPHGRTVILQNKKLLGPTITCDGVTIANRISVPNRFVNLGCKIIQEVSETTNDKVGDGTTTSLILAQQMVKESLRRIETGCNHLKLLAGMHSAMEKTMQILTEMTIPIQTREEIMNIATVSSGSSEIADLIAQAYDKVGTAGVVTIEEGKKTYSYLDYVDGIKFDKGYISPQMINTPKLAAALIKDALILITDDRISYIHEVMPALEQAMATGKPLLIIAEDISVDLLGVLLTNLKNNTITVIVATVPGSGDRRQAYLDDIAVLTGGTVIAKAREITLEDVTLAHLGTAQEIIVNKTSTTIIGGWGDKSLIRDRAVAVRKEMEPLREGFRREKLQERLGWLEGGIAKIKAGAATATEAVEARYRIEDAVCSVRSALTGGVLPGGGISLYRASEQLKQIRLEDADENLGWRLMAESLQAPLRQLIANCGENEAEVLDNIADLPDNCGYNAMTRKYEDMISGGVIDAAQVTIQALQNAYSIARLIIDTEGLLVHDMP